MVSLHGQSAGSRRLPRPASDSRRSPLNTRSVVRWWAEPQTPPLETLPRGVGASRLPRACPMGGGQGVARCFLSNGKASEEEGSGRRHGRGPIGGVRDCFGALFFVVLILVPQLSRRHSPPGSVVRCSPQAVPRAWVPPCRFDEGTRSPGKTRTSSSALAAR